MLDDRLARERPDVVRAGLRRRHAGAAAETTLDAWRELDAKRRRLAAERDQLALAVATGAATREAVEQAQRALAETERAARICLLALPNLPDARVPEGETAGENVEVRRWGAPRTFDFAPQPHLELGAALGLFDLTRATKLAGPPFPLFWGEGGPLERELGLLLLELRP